MLQAGIEFRNDYIEAIERLDIYNFSQDTVAWWDDPQLAGGASAIMDYEIEASPLLPGQYNGLIRLESNDPDTPATEIPVQLTVTDPAAAGLTLIRNESGLVEEGGCFVLGEETLLADSPDAAMQDIVYSVTDTGHGHLEVNGETANSFTQAQLAAGLVSYCHDGSDTSATTQFGFTITDGAESIGPLGTTMAVGAVNDSPVLDPLAGNGDPMHHSFDGVHLRIQFPQRARIPQLDWSAQWSRTPQGPWSANGVLYETLQDHGDWMLREARIPFVDGEGMFLRLSIERVP